MKIISNIYKRLSSRYGIFVVMSVIAIVLIPLWSSQIPPLLDYPNHLARQYILSGLQDSEILQNFYQVEWRVAPYLAIDGIVQVLAKFLTIETSGKIFLSLTLFFIAISPIVLNLVLFGRVTPIALMGLLFVHNTTLSLGFVGYLFSIGFAICLLAMWIRLREAALWVRLIIFPILSWLLFLSHLIGFSIYALLVGSYELGRHLEKNTDYSPRALLSFNSVQRLNLISLTLQFVLPVLIYLVLAPSVETVGNIMSQNTYGGVWRKIENLGGIFFYLISPYAWTWDRIFSFVLSGMTILLMMFRIIEVPKRMLWPLAAMLLLYFSMPMALFGGWGADHRLLVPIGLLLAGSLRIRANTGTRMLWKSAILFIAILVIVRVATITVEWRRINDDEYAEYIQAFDSLADGSKVYYAFGHAGSKKNMWPGPVYHIPHLALMEKQVYVPYLFISELLPLQYSPAFKSLQHITPGGPVLMNGGSPNWRPLLEEFDFFMLVNEQFFKTPVPEELDLVFKGEKVRVYMNTISK